MSTTLEYTGNAEAPGTDLCQSAVRRASRSGLEQFRSFCANLARKRAERQLHALDDRLLKDIGIDRSEIGSVLRNQCHEHRRRGL